MKPAPAVSFRQFAWRALSRTWSTAVQRGLALVSGSVGESTSERGAQIGNARGAVHELSTELKPTLNLKES